jgi:hypothetical protein
LGFLCGKQEAPALVLLKDLISVSVLVNVTLLPILWLKLGGQRFSCGWLIEFPFPCKKKNCDESK